MQPRGLRRHYRNHAQIQHQLASFIAFVSAIHQQRKSLRAWVPTLPVGLDVHADTIAVAIGEPDGEVRSVEIGRVALARKVRLDVQGPCIPDEGGLISFRAILSDSLSFLGGLYLLLMPIVLLGSRQLKPRGWYSLHRRLVLGDVVLDLWSLYLQQSS